jgi:hypothetical protein
MGEGWWSAASQQHRDLLGARATTVGGGRGGGVAWVAGLGSVALSWAVRAVRLR